MTSAVPTTIDDVRARYDAMAALVASIPRRPPGDGAATAAAVPFLATEARLLDLGEHAAWLDLLAPDAVLWVPLTRSAHPGTDQALFLDDRRRLTERVRWREDPSAWGQQPPSVCVRTVGSVEAWHDGDTIVAHSSIVIAEQRAGRTQLLTGHQLHELSGDGRSWRTKILLLPALHVGLRNPSFLL